MNTKLQHHAHDGSTFGAVQGFRDIAWAPSDLANVVGALDNGGLRAEDAGYGEEGVCEYTQCGHRAAGTERRCKRERSMSP